MKKFLKYLEDVCKNHKVVLINIFIGLLIFMRFWLMNSTNWYVDLDTFYDSRLEIGTAINMIAGRWAGEYTKYTLCKNLSYPIFIATVYKLHLTYPIGLCTLICFASFLFARSLKPVFKSDTLRKIIFIIILYNPVGLSYQAAYHYRNAITPWIVLIIISSILAIYLRRNENVKKLLLWALVGMFFVGFFWNLREDSIWFLPFILAGIIATTLHFWIDNKKNKTIKSYICFVSIAILPILGIFIWNNAISFINYKHYGIYATNDRTQTYSAKVLGELIKIDDGTSMDEDYWVSSKAVALARDVSPTFAKLNVDVFESWPKHGDYSIWALRDSANDIGYYTDAKSTNEMYKKIYEELNQAFKEGKLKAKKGIQLSSTSGIYTGKEFVKAFQTGFLNFINHVMYKEYKIERLEEILHVSNDGEFNLYENTLGIRLRRTEQQLDEIHADLTTKIQNDNVIKSLYHNIFYVNIIVKIYNVLSPILFLLAIVGTIMIGIDIFKNKNYQNYNVELLIFLIGIILICYLNSYLVCLWATSFYFTLEDHLYIVYTTSQTLMLCCFEIIGTLVLLKKAYLKLRNLKGKK